MRLKETDVHCQALEHLGLVASVIRSTGLIEKIDARIPVSTSKGAKLSIGQRIAAMILNGLGFTNDRLYMFPSFLEGKPVARLLGEGLMAEDFNDDSLGRALDLVYEYSPTALFSELAFEIGIQEGLIGASAHFDTTSLSLYGEYEQETVIEESEADKLKTPDEKERKPIEVTHGYSKANRPDLKQVVLTLATTGAANYPIWMEGCSGNTSDKAVLQASAKRMQAFCKQLEQAPSFLYVGDSAMYERCVKEAGELRWLSRVPERLNEAKKWIRTPDDQLSWTALEDGYRMAPLSGASYGDVPQRWIVIHSEHARIREEKTLQRHIKKEAEASTKLLWHIGNQDFACEKDALKTGIDANKKLKYHKMTWQTIPVEKHQKPGRPKAGAPLHITGYKLVGELRQDEERITELLREKGRFILASNELNKEQLPDDLFLSEYKGQIKTEQGFRFIKSDAFEVDSVFLKKPSRIEALMMVMTLCLMVYAIAQETLRKALAEAPEPLEIKHKPKNQPVTMTRVFKLFRNVQLLTIQGVEGVQELVTNLSSVLKRIIGYFGKHCELMYASSA
jgi:transposase